MNRSIPVERYEGLIPSPFAIYRIPFIGALGLTPASVGIASLSGARR